MSVLGEGSFLCGSSWGFFHLFLPVIKFFFFFFSICRVPHSNRGSKGQRMLFHCTVWKACWGNVIVGYINKIDLNSFDHSTCCVNDPMYHYPEKSELQVFFYLTKDKPRQVNCECENTEQRRVKNTLLKLIIKGNTEMSEVSHYTSRTKKQEVVSAFC